MELSLRIDVQAQQAKAELRETEKHIDNTSKAAKDLDKAVGDAEKRLNKSFAEMEKSAAKMEREVEKLGQTTERKVTPAMGGLNSTLLRFAGPAVIGLALKSAADFADRLEELQVQTGLSIKKLMEFDKAAKENGSSLEAVARAASTFQDRLAGGDKSLVRALERLGISYDAIRNKTPDQQMMELARAVSAIEDPAKRANIAIDLFGRSGVALIPTLKAMTENGGKTGVMTEDTAKKVGQLSDAFVKLKDSSIGLVGNVFAPLAGALATVADLFEKASSKMSGFLASATGPIGMYQDLVGQFGDPSNMPAINNTGKLDARLAIWQDFLSKGKSYADGLAKAGQSPAAGLFGTDQLFGYTGEVEGQINDQLKEQARLHKARGDAAEEASRRAKKAAAEELSAWNDLLANNRQLLSDATAALGEDFNLFFGRQFTPRGGVYQDQNYFGLTDVPTIPSRDLGGVMGPIMPPASGGNIAQWVNGPQRRPSAQERWNAQWINNYGDYSSWSEGFQSAGNAIGTYGPAMEDLARGDTEVLRATNIMGRGNRAKAGMMAGAAEGGKYGGPYGAAGGAVVGLIIGAARNPMFEDIYNRVGANYDQRGISEDLARQIEATTKDRFEGNRQAGEVYSLSSIMGERPIDEKNVGQMTARLHDAFSMRETEQFSEEDLQKTLDSSFGAFADYYNRIGGLADETFTEIIELQRRFGVESETVTQYVEQQTSEALGGLYTFLETSTIQSGEAAKGLMGAAVAVFAQLKEGPEGLKGALAEMGPVIATVDASIQKFGVEADVTFNDMRNLISTMANEDVVNAVTAVSGLGQTMTGLNNAVLLNEDTYSGLARAIADTRNGIVAQGADGEHVNRLMQKDLQTIWELHKNNGYAVDEVTQKLLDEAEAQGVVGQKFKEVNQQILDQQREGFTALIEAVGGEVPESWRAVEDASAAAEQKVKDDAAQMAAAQGEVSGSVEDIGRRLQEGQTDWSEWARAGVAAAEEVSYAVDAVSLGHSPGGIKEIPIKLREAIAAAHEFKRQSVADFEATEAAVNALSDEQADAIRLLMDVGRPLNDIAFALDMSTQSLELFIDRERDAAAAAEDAARAVEQQRLETERMSESLLAMQSRAQDDLSVLRATGINKDMLQLDQRQRDELAAAEAMRPTLGHAVDQTIALINQKFEVLRNEVGRRYNDEFNRDLAAREARTLQNEERYNETAQRLQDQIALIGKSGLERDLLQLGFGRRDEMADIQRMRDILSGPQIEALFSAIAIKYARLEAEARADEVARVGGAMLGGYVGAHGIQYLRTGGKVLGFQPRGSDTVPAMLTPGEGVLSRRGMQALASLNRGDAMGGGDVFHITVNGSDDPEAVADAILRKVAQKRKLSRGRRAA